jgi:hypothetical protein
MVYNKIRIEKKEKSATMWLWKTSNDSVSSKLRINDADKLFLLDSPNANTPNKKILRAPNCGAKMPIYIGQIRFFG